MRKQRYVKPGERVRVIGNYSEIMTVFKLAGRPIEIELIQHQENSGNVYHSAQIWKDKQPFSGPVTTSEAGFYYDSEKGQHYCYEDDGPGDENPGAIIEETTNMLKQALDGPGVVTITNLGLG